MHFLRLSDSVLVDCKPVIFFANASDGPYSNERSGASVKTGREVRDAKKYGCPPCMYQIRSKLPVLPATGNSHWSYPDAICHQMSITPHQKDIDAVSVSLESQILVGKWTMLTCTDLRAI